MARPGTINSTRPLDASTQAMSPLRANSALASSNCWWVSGAVGLAETSAATPDSAQQDMSAIALMAIERNRQPVMVLFPFPQRIGQQPRGERPGPLCSQLMCQGTG